MKSALPIIVLALLMLALVLYTRRNRERAVARQTEMQKRIRFGSEVMTTSGLYGTVTRVNGDDTVQLTIAPGVQVRWAIAALRDVESLPDQYRGPVEPDGTAEDADGPPGDNSPH